MTAPSTDALVAEMRAAAPEAQHQVAALLERAADALAAAQERLAEVYRLRKRANNQRTELRRLNKYLGPYWAGFRRGADFEAACKLRGIMNETFGHDKVRAAEHAAIDRAIEGEKP